NYCAGANHGIFANGDSTKNGGVASDRSAFLHNGFNAFPVGIGLHAAIGIGGAGKQVVGKHHAMPYKYIILNTHTLANKSMARNLATASYAYSLLYFHDCAHFAIVANGTAISVDKIEYAHIFANGH